MKIKYKQLIYLFPKYVKSYKNKKPGEILESAVTVINQKTNEYYSPNDPTLLERRVVYMYPQSGYRGWNSCWLIGVI